MATNRDYYEVLHLERAASNDDIKRAYRRMAMKFHPDRNPGDEEAEKQFKEAAEAYEVLSDGERRSVYDKYGHDGLRGRPGHDFNTMNPNDIFSMFNDIFSGFDGFGGGGGRRRQSRGVARGYDLETKIEVDLKDVLHGTSADVDFTRMDICDTCKGDGAKPGSKPTKCSTCDGNGQVMQAGLGGMFRMVTACPACKGRGTVIEDPCPDCSGNGRQPKRRVLEVKIPAGVQTGQAVAIRGEGEPPGADQSPTGQGIRGDLHVVIEVHEHELFDRDGDDLFITVPVTFSQAALGSELDIPTLDDESHLLKIAKGTQYGKRMKIGGKGVPNLRTQRRGDLYATVTVEVPKKLSTEQEQLLRNFAKTEDVSVQPESHGFLSKIKDFLGTGDDAT